MLIRKLTLVAALLVAGLAPATPALAAQAPPASTPNTSMSAMATIWYIEGYYDQLTCLDRGSFGVSSGWWLDYYCEPDYGGDPNSYRLWVEDEGSSTGNCATAGHAYLINGSTLYFSGYEGNYQNGVSTTWVPSGYAVIALGGNGIKKNTAPQFKLQLNGVDVANHSWTVNSAGDNCVSNQVNKTLNLQAGQTYTLKAHYTAGNGNVIDETVVYVYAY
ncbi:hypothetical protein [Phytohabitans rumicis]|uniref:PA14 domain-containing protein n=1 Tax=Phytohabitans rumicis TaxID=1076125 RepID=A0A6V8KNP6_9ACTN|nr:hypothetical protein [Phytohabitans rumicis]GFJ86783.1 hypothetical protein Prum_004250 [Phytohabitans rumicis]